MGKLALGALAFVVDIYVFNLLRLGWWPLTEPPLAHKVVACKIISVAVATVVAWAGNRWWTGTSTPGWLRSPTAPSCRR